VIALDEKLCEKQLLGTWQSLLIAAGELLDDVPVPPLVAAPATELLVCFGTQGAKVEVVRGEAKLQARRAEYGLGAAVFGSSGLFRGIFTQSGLLEWSKVKLALSRLSSASLTSLTGGNRA
jgi:hypothetical protein